MRKRAVRKTLATESPSLAGEVKKCYEIQSPVVSASHVRGGLMGMSYNCDLEGSSHVRERTVGVERATTLRGPTSDRAVTAREPPPRASFPTIAGASGGAPPSAACGASIHGPRLVSRERPWRANTGQAASTCTWRPRCAAAVAHQAQTRAAAGASATKVVSA